MSLAIGFINYNSIQDYQNWLHNTNDSETPFYREHIRVSWHSTFLEELEYTKDEDSITFFANGRAHFLLYTNFIFNTPEIISHNPNIEVAWTPNLLHNFVQEAELKFNDISIQEFDTVGADILIQLEPRSGEGKRAQYLRDIGNLSQLTSFSNRLPSTRLSLHCPWSFSKKASKSIPLCLSSTTIVKMKFKIRQNPLELIRIREKNRDDFHLRALECNDQVSIDEIKLPHLNGKYALVSQKEIEWHKKIPNRELFFDTLEKYDSYDSHQMTLSSNYPVRALFPVAQNMTASAINNHSNYTTNPFNCYLGVSPISHYTLYYQTIKILDNVESEVFSNDEPYWNCSACPESPGYSAIIFPSSLERDEDVGIALGPLNGKLSATINDTQSEYHFKVRALSSRVVRYENGIVTVK
jgi:hypothetical protein